MFDNDYVPFEEQAMEFLRGLNHIELVGLDEPNMDPLEFLNGLTVAVHHYGSMTPAKRRNAGEATSDDGTTGCTFSTTRRLNGNGGYATDFHIETGRIVRFEFDPNLSI